MAKKKTTKQRKRQNLKANPKRQAHNQLRGYLYQIWRSVNAWLDLADDEILYLEGAEDFDIASDDADTAVQVKGTKNNITLRSREVTDAINNYWGLRIKNPDWRVKFRLLTRSKIGTEQGNPFGAGKQGLQVWSHCLGDEATITELSKFLQSEGKISDDVKNFLNQAEPQEIYEQLIEPIAWETGCKPASLVEQSIIEKLIIHGDRHGILPSEAEKVLGRLLKEALNVAKQKENRELTKRYFRDIFEEETTLRVPMQHWRRLQMLEAQTKKLDIASTQFLGVPSDDSIQSHAFVLNTIPRLYPDAIPRSNLITSIQTKLKSEGIAVIHGGAARGKTTLAKLVANDLNGDWFWLNFTSDEPLQVKRHLQQLAIAVNNQSSQVNIVLDDLNLQHQEFRQYEEVLGVVNYTVLERGANVLITSQHEPHDNLTRHLGVSRSIVVHVPDFTLSEIEQFAKQLGCPAEHTKTWARLVQLHTNGHPSLVHARLIRLREGDWKQKDIIDSLMQKPPEVVKEQELAQQLLTQLPDEQREFLYRLSLIPTEFRRDYALNIGDMPESIPYPGVIFDRLVGPWIDQVTEAYFIISPLLTNVAEQVWPESKTRELRAQIADAILKTRNLTIIETRAVFLNSMVGQNTLGFIAVIQALRTASEDSWKELRQEFSWLINGETHIPERFFPGDVFVNHLFRSLQHRIAVEVEPKAAPNILENWDRETVSYEPHHLYLQNRLLLATQALRYYQIPLPAKRIVGYLEEIINITESNNEAREIYYNSYIVAFEEQETNESNYFSTLFSFCYRAPNPKLYPPFLSDLIDALDELQPEIRGILLADFEDDSVDCRLLIDGVWLAESKIDNPNWKGCLQIFDKVIEKTIEWGYLHLAATSARGKAIIHDEYLHDPDSAHKILQDIVSKVGALPVIEEEQANVYFGQRNYQEALNIYERILPEWNPPSVQLNLGPLEEYRRAAICAAQLNDWEKAATIFEEGAKRTPRNENAERQTTEESVDTGSESAKRTQEIENTERYIGLCADAGFANFKAGNMLQSIKLLNLALREFGRLVEDDNKEDRYFTLKKCLAGSIKWITEQESESESSEPDELPAGLCSDPETNEKILALPDFQIGYAWLYLAQIEFKFGHDTSVLEEALQTLDRDAHPNLNFSLLLLQTKYDFRYKRFDDLPHRIYQLALACELMKKDRQLRKGVDEKGIDSSRIADSTNFASVENVIFILGTALLVQLQTRTDMHDILKIWRTKSWKLPIKEEMVNALDRIESVLLGDKNEARTVMTSQEPSGQMRLVAALTVIHDTKTSANNLFYAHTLIATSLIGTPWEDFVAVDMGILFSAQWLERIKSGAMSQMNNIIIRQIEQACNDCETGKKKIGQILLATYPVVSLRVPSDHLQKFRNWAASKSNQKLEPKTAKNPVAQRLIRAMEKPPHLTDEDVETLRQSIEEGEIPVKLDSPFEAHQHMNRGEIMQGEFPLNLSVSPKEAVQKLQARIDAGQSLHDRSINTQDILVETLKKLKIWCRDNRYLLSKLFRTSSNADNYNNLCKAYPITSATSASFASSGLASNASHEFARTSNIFREVTSEHIEKLTNIRDGIMLHCERSDLSQRKVENNKMTDNSTNTIGHDVFIVHGRDEEAKETVARFVEKLGLKATILHEKPSRSLTIIEKIEKYSDSAGFAIVLLTPDDIGALKDSPNDERNPRARQNVVFELGYFMGKLGRERVCPLFKDELEKPSDIDGIVYVPMDGSNGWKLKLAQEMKQAGLPVDLNKLAQ